MLRINTRGEEGSPPPIVVLGTKLEVGEHHSDLGTGDGQNEEYHQQKSEHVIVLVHPDGGEDEEELHETSSEWENTANQTGDGGSQIPGLEGDLSRHIRVFNWKFDGILLVGQAASYVNEGAADADPKEDDSQEVEEGNSPTRSISPDYGVEDEEDGEGDEREEEGGHEGVFGELGSIEGFVEPGGDVTGHSTHHDKEEEEGDHEGATVGRRQKPDGGEYDGEQGHPKDLPSSASEDAEEHGVGDRRSEHISVDQFPSSFLQLISIRIVGWGGERTSVPVVVGNISMEGSDQDHPDHGREEEDDEEGVDY